MIERSANKNSIGEGSAFMHSITSLVDDFFTGNTHDGNMGAMMNHYAEHGCGNADIANFWEASGLAIEGQNVQDFFKMNPVDTDACNENYKFSLD